MTTPGTSHSVADVDLNTTCIDLTADDSPDVVAAPQGPARMTRSSSSNGNTIDLTTPVDITNRRRGPAGPRKRGQVRTVPSYPLFRPSTSVQTSPCKRVAGKTATTQTEFDSDDEERSSPCGNSNDPDDLPPLKHLLGADFAKRAKLAKAKAAMKDSPTAVMTCPVCLDDLKELRKQNVGFQSTPCGHVFCQPCIQGTLARGGAASICPTCRKDVKQRDLRVLFL